jgi:hypothetical protein
MIIVRFSVRLPPEDYANLIPTVGISLNGGGGDRKECELLHVTAGLILLTRTTVKYKIHSNWYFLR